MWAAVVLALALVRVLVMCLSWIARLVGQHAVQSCVIRLEGSPSVSLELDGFEKLHLYPSKMRSESSSLRVPPNGLFLGLFPPSLLLFAGALKLESFQ